MWRDRKELERGMKSLIKTKKFRKYIIKNIGTISKLKLQVSRILKDVKSHKTSKTVG
jgi:hypothetical protein